MQLLARTMGSRYPWAPTLPAAPFPQRHDHPAEPAGRVAPVALPRPPRPLRAPRLDLLHDLLVLLDRARDLVYQRAGVQPHVALRLRLDRVVQRQEPQARSRLHVGPVKARVQIEDA